ncbi:MAG TPA: beta-propeller domain-containing protein, partial [Steroidobacteraceae bacterium]|nr:beta-propeller domain-containing protein [Steroidobacteraceae bacterium]
IQSGVKVQLFDVRDLANPQSVGAFTFGRSWSDATWDPHALTFLSLPGPATSYRMAMHLDVYDTPMPTVPNSYSYTFSGLHLFEIDGLEGNAPQLQFHGVLTAQTAASRSFASPIRSVLHDDSVFYIFGDKNISSLWQNVPAQ